MLGALCQVVAYAVQSPAPPFPVLVIFSALNGFGMAIQDAQASGYVAVMKHNPDRKMGVLHAVYGATSCASKRESAQSSQAWARYVRRGHIRCCVC